MNGHNLLSYLKTSFLFLVFGNKGKYLNLFCTVSCDDCLENTNFIFKATDTVCCYTQRALLIQISGFGYIFGADLISGRNSLELQLNNMTTRRGGLLDRQRSTYRNIN